jgi:arabinofuranosyltransferase
LAISVSFERPVIVRRQSSLPVLLMLGLYAVVLVRTAWVSDDAYITFRTVDNFLSGYGLRWNVGERVQTYTHPLWMFLVSGATAVLRESYYASLALAFACTLSALALFARRVAADVPMAMVGLTVLLFSQAFVDFSTSGLENPLVHLLLVVFLLEYWSFNPSPKDAGVLAAVAGLLMLTRLDAGLIVLPALGEGVLRGIKSPQRRVPRMRILVAVSVGVLPVVAWELFSLVYYGFPFPNTAYAKLQTGIPSSELLEQGFTYLQDSFARDPITLTAIAAGISVPLYASTPQVWTLAAGIALHLIYVVRIGGDFMSGRFLTPTLMVSVCLMARFAPAVVQRWWPMAMAGAIAVGSLSPPRPLFTGVDYGEGTWQRIARSGIADERRFYYPSTGLLRMHRRFPTPDTDEPERVQRYLSEGRWVVQRDMVGFFGAAAGRRLHVVDVLGLGDPLLARLPTQHPWRVGHYYRVVPEGYMETIQEGVNRIRDPQIAAYYDTLKLVIQAPLWSGARWRAIVVLNLGRQTPTRAPR